MAPPNSKNIQDDVVSDTSSLSSTGTSHSYDSMSTTSTRSSNRRSRSDSFVSSDYSGRTRSGRSFRASGSGASQKSIQKKKKKSAPKRRSRSKRTKSPLKKKKKTVRPLGRIGMVKNLVIRKQVRQFVSEYSNGPDFEAFSLTVDGIPFIALSLLNAKQELQDKFKKTRPPTPMKKHTPGTNSPRKRPLRRNSTSRYSSENTKCVRFTDESCSPKKAKNSLYEETHGYLGSDVLPEFVPETENEYETIWEDPTNSVEKDRVGKIVSKRNRVNK